MGRYYDGDINGKFMFGIQCSLDAEFFGQQGFNDSIDFYFTEDDETNVQAGLDKCLTALGENKAHLDSFYEGVNHYNYTSLSDYLQSKTGSKYSENKVRNLLEWYARNDLGTKILTCIKETGECRFTAELV